MAGAGAVQNREHLKADQRQGKRAKRGKLKIFFGMARGVGKTTALLAEARREQAGGRDVAVAFLQTKGRTRISSQAEGLPHITGTRAAAWNRPTGEVDLDAVLARRPQLVIVDELAGSNSATSRHPKRYQDVLELLDAGMDVFTTLNIGNVESCAEAVRQITGAAPSETVPDTHLQGAELVLVDIAIPELRARLASEAYYAREAASAAQQQIFRPGSLSALRELTLRFVAEHIGRDVLASRQAGKGEPWKSSQRLLVAVSSSQASAALIRWTRRLAGELHATWVAVHVESRKPLSREEQNLLNRHLTLAKELGAQIISTTDDDIACGLLRVAREQQATQIVIGKPERRRWLDVFRGRSLFHRLVRDSGTIDVHAVRAEEQPRVSRLPTGARIDAAVLREYGLAVATVAALILLNEALKGQLGYQNLGLIFLMGIVLLALFVRRGPTVAAAVLSALAWDFFFEEPLYSFRISSPADLIMTVTYLVVALVVGSLTSRLREKETTERRREQHATGLYLLTRSLAQASHVDDILEVVTREVGKITQAEVNVSLSESGQEELKPFSGGTWVFSEEEQKVAAWTLRNRQPAGRGTSTTPSAEGLHLPLLAGDRILGVLSLRLHENSLTTDQRDLLEAFVRQIALALDRERLRDAEQHAKLVAESERLSKTLLNSVSHEIRTPLAAIMSAASTLSERPDNLPRRFQQEMVDEIQEASQRLNRLVGNLLNMTRLETGHVKPKMDWCEVDDLVQATAEDIESDLTRHRLALEIAPGLPLVRMDIVLMQQVLTNLLLNASVHTPPGTTVHLSATMEADELVFKVADNGPGLPPEALAQIFEKFYRAPAAPAGGTGLGLAIVKGFVEAHGGQVIARNRPEGGLVFTIRLPAPALSRRTSEPDYERLART
jgi:two-component system sensor histidine kinase KdpD